MSRPISSFGSRDKIHNCLTPCRHHPAHHSLEPFLLIIDPGEDIISRATAVLSSYVCSVRNHHQLDGDLYCVATTSSSYTSTPRPANILPRWPFPAAKHGVQAFIIVPSFHPTISQCGSTPSICLPLSSPASTWKIRGHICILPQQIILPLQQQQQLLLLLVYHLALNINYGVAHEEPKHQLMATLLLTPFLKSADACKRGKKKGVEKRACTDGTRS